MYSECAYRSFEYAHSVLLLFLVLFSHWARGRSAKTLSAEKDIVAGFFPSL